VLARRDRTYQDYFRRLAAGEQPGFPRLQGAKRYHSCTNKEYGNGARLDNGVLVLTKIGCIAVRWSCTVAGTIKTVTVSLEADGWSASFASTEMTLEPLQLTGGETGVDVGLKVLLLTADGEGVEHPRHYCKAEKQLQQAQKLLSRKQKGSKRRDKAQKPL